MFGFLESSKVRRIVQNQWNIHGIQSKFEELKTDFRKSWHEMGCVTSKVPDIIGEGYRLKVKKTVAVGGSAKIMEVDPGGGKELLIAKKIVAFTKREEERVKLEAELYKKLENNEFVIDLIAHIIADVDHYLLFTRYSLNFSEYLEHIKTGRQEFQELQHLKYFLGIVSAIEELHGYGYAHFDLKPANILKTGDTIKLIDFGSATQMPLEIKTSADHRRYREDAEERCSMMYRAPELFSCEIGSTLTTAVDVWSLGVCLYEFMFLQNPFNKVYEQGGSIALAAQSPEMIKWENEREVTQNTVEIIKKALTVDPETRPTAGEIRKRVEEVIEQLSNGNSDGQPRSNLPTARELTDEEFDEAMRTTVTT